ncbi:MAG: guanylate kinase [Spirochaetia bacterium]|nr:guanylate kinase [Spirochaetia bacterium]
MKFKTFILSAPSGAGKNTIINEILKRRNDILYSISTTSRIPRENEIDGSHYHFISKEEFKKKIAAGEFLEWALVLDNYYGTFKSEIDKIFSRKKHAILDLDIQGALKVKEENSEVVLIFVMPPNMNELKKRLQERRTDSEAEIEKRLKLAEKEMEARQKYDYILVNKNLNETVEELDSIISECAVVP